MKLLLSALLALLACPTLLGDEPIKPGPELVGHWTGTAKFVNEGFLDKTFLVDLQIKKDGSVTGTVGDATLIEGQIMRHRPEDIGRKQSDLMDYMITGKPSGTVSKGVVTSSIYIPLDLTDEKFDAAVHLHHGATILSAELTLHKQK